ncbi:MAG: hypothetical protein FWB78_07335 [Treponema sp.]|nr:hypothetical protein [Treponema sp.]
MDRLVSSFPPIAMVLLLVAALVAVSIFIVGFTRHGINFLKYGIKQVPLGDSLQQQFDNLETRLSNKITALETKFDNRFSQLDDRITALDSRITVIETNHFGHLKGFLSELTGILLDKTIINNAEKARLDHQLSGM